jgi:hypothetical protein
LGLFAPLALLALPLVVIIVALYLLKLRRPSAPVASLHLWGSITRDREANSLWQRLRVTTLLFLQLLALIVLILALARPWVPSQEAIGQNVVIVVDVSASMGSVDSPGGPTRFREARDRAKQIIDNMPQDASAMLIATDNHASIIVPTTDDRARLRSAVDALQARPVPTDMKEALTLAGAVAARQQNSAVWVLSDGAFSSVANLVDPIPATVTFVPIGKPSGNQGITGLSLDNGSSGLSLFVQLSNSEDVTVSRRLDLIADDAPWSARNVTIGPQSSMSIVVPDVPLSARVLSAQLAGTDALSVDDEAWVINRSSVPANVLLVSSGNKFLELSLSLLPTVTLYKVAPADYKPNATINGVPFDLTIFDAGIPTSTYHTMPAGALMLFDPPAQNPIIGVSDTITEPVLSVPRSTVDGVPGASAEPLLRYVDLSQVHVARAHDLALPSWGRAVLSSQSGPLIVAGQQNNRNVVAFGFDLHDSDLAVQTAFPLLMRNLVTYLLPLPAGGLPAEVPPGQPVSIDLVGSNVDQVIIEDPSARDQTLPVVSGTTRLAFGDTIQPGVYYVTQYAGQQIVAEEAFAVNLFSRDESLTLPNLTPGLPAGRAVAAQSPGPATADDSIFRREIWPIVALSGFLVLLLEWLFAQRVVIRRSIIEMQNRRALRRARS